MITISFILTVPALPKIIQRWTGPSGMLRVAVDQTLESILNQTQCPPFEIILIDGMTREEIALLAKNRHFGRLSPSQWVFDVTDRAALGHGELKKRGLKKSRGQWVCFLEPGQTVPSGQLAQIKSYLEQNRSSSLSAFLSTNLDPPYPKNWMSELIKQNWIGMGTCFFKISDLEKLEDIPSSSFGIALKILDSGSPILFLKTPQPAEISQPVLAQEIATGLRDWAHVLTNLPKTWSSALDRAKMQGQNVIKKLKH